MHYYRFTNKLMSLLSFDKGSPRRKINWQPWPTFCILHVQQEMLQAIQQDTQCPRNDLVASIDELLLS